MRSSRCTFTTSDGRRCRSFTYPGHASLCHQHLRKELDGAPPSEDIAADILSSIHNFQSAAAINAALGRIFALLAAGRIKRQEALSLAYMCQLMLQSLKGFKHEICLTTYEKIFERDLLRVLNARTPLEEFVFPPPQEEAVQEEAAPEETPPEETNDENFDENSKEEEDSKAPAK
jgi:hypothetical protein